MSQVTGTERGVERRPEAVDRTEPSRGVQVFASVVSGLLVGLLLGLLGGFLLSEGHYEVALIGAGAGVVIGGLFLRRIAMSDSVLGGAAVGAFLPIGLMLIGALRSGRLFEASAEDFISLQALMVMGGALVGGATMGALLVLIRKGIARALTPSR